MKENLLLLRFHRLSPLAKIFIALLLALAIYLLMQHQPAAMRFMSAWICFCLVEMGLSWTIMLTAHPREIVQLAKNQDNSRFQILLIILGASFVSLVIIVLLLKSLPEAGEKGYYIYITLSFVAIASSWFLIHTIFTAHYAHLYYTGKTGDKSDKSYKGGLEFPNEKLPAYMDFAYFSFVIGMTFQVSDVEISSRLIRKRVLLHGLISFLFNTIILAVSINIIAGMVHK